MRFATDLNDYGVIEMFKSNGYEWVDATEPFDFAVFCGGEDVCPSEYGEKEIPQAGVSCNPVRDLVSKELWVSSVGKPKIGICRGSQFLHVMNGGKLYQHVSGHGATHSMYLSEDFYGQAPGGQERFAVTSTHHQMMVPTVGQIVAWGEVNDCNYISWVDGHEGEYAQRKRVNIQTESMWNFRTNSFCYQPHPEYVLPDHDCRVFFWNMLEYLFQIEGK